MKTEKKEKVVGVRLTQAQYEQVMQLAKDRYLTASTLGRILFELYLRQEVTI